MVVINTLSKDFVKYIENTTNLCIYKLSSYNTHNIFFPKVNTLTLINCDKYSITSILHPNIFPNLKSVHYLSTNPGDYSIYERFGKDITWVFPNKYYDFYDLIISHGRGRKDPELINKYITNKKIIDGKYPFDISLKCDLIIPEYGIVTDKWWKDQLDQYILLKQNISKQNKKYTQEFEENKLTKIYMMKTLRSEYENILEMQ
jgi:hypothetical protein